MKPRGLGSHMWLRSVTIYPWRLEEEPIFSEVSGFSSKKSGSVSRQKRDIE
jgi:hypothetical protein